MRGAYSNVESANKYSLKNQSLSVS